MGFSQNCPVVSSPQALHRCASLARGAVTRESSVGASERSSSTDASSGSTTTRPAVHPPLMKSCSDERMIGSPFTVIVHSSDVIRSRRVRRSPGATSEPSPTPVSTRPGTRPCSRSLGTTRTMTASSRLFVTSRMTSWRTAGGAGVHAAMAKRSTSSPRIGRRIPADASRAAKSGTAHT